MKKTKRLDYLLIPTGWRRQRKERAIDELGKRDVKNILILNGNNSEEDILYLGKVLRGGEKIGFVTFPLHYQEYKDIIKKAQIEKKFPKKIKTENIATKETIKQSIYGILGLIDEKFNNDVEYTKNKNENHFYLRIRKFIKNFLK